MGITSGDSPALDPANIWRCVCDEAQAADDPGDMHAAARLACTFLRPHFHPGASHCSRCLYWLPPMQVEGGHRGRGEALATFADVDKTGKVRNALKFKCPTKQV